MGVARHAVTAPDSTASFLIDPSLLMTPSFLLAQAVQQNASVMHWQMCGPELLPKSSMRVCSTQ